MSLGSGSGCVFMVCVADDKVLGSIRFASISNEKYYFSFAQCRGDTKLPQLCFVEAQKIKSLVKKIIETQTVSKLSFVT